MNEHLKKYGLKDTRPIPQRDNKAESDFLKLLFVTLLITFPLLFYVALGVTYMVVDYKISELVRKKEELKRERAMLIIEKEKLLNLSAVEEISYKKLGMIKESLTEIKTNFNEGIFKSIYKREKSE